MSNHQKHGVRLLQRTLELQKFPMGSAPMCIPVIADTYEDLLKSNTGPLIVHRSTQVAFVGTASGTSDLPHRVTSPFPGKQARKANAVMPEETASSVCPDGRHAPKNEHLMISGSLGQCDESDCVDYPLASKNKMLFPRSSAPFSNGDGGWRKKIVSSLPNIPIINPHARAVRQWNRFFVISCLAAIFVDPLFFFLASMDKDNKCIMFSRRWRALTVARYVTDGIYFLHMLLQFRMAYVDPESRIVGTGDLVDDEPKKIAMRYLRGAFIVDLSAMLPLPQVMIEGVIPKYIGVSGANYAKNLLRATVIVQYAPRIFRFVQLLGGQSANGFIFESAWANFVMNLLVFILAGHVVGSLWYIFGLQIRLFALKDCGLCDAVCDKLKHKLYSRGSDILSQDQLVEKIIFAVRGKLGSINVDGSKSPLHEGAVCGEELLTWWFEQQASASKLLSDGERMKVHWKVRLAILEDRCSNPYPDMVEVPSKATQGSCSVARNVASTNYPLTTPSFDTPDVEDLFASPSLLTEVLLLC